METFKITENCLCLIFGESIDEEVNRKIVNLKNKIDDMQIDGIYEVVISYNRLYIYFNDDILTHDGLIDTVNTMNIEEDDVRMQRTIVIPVCYEAPHALDIDELARDNDLTVEEVIKLHTERKYLVYMLGFMPGFPFLGGLDDRLMKPRKQTPRKEIPAGSVGIAGGQTGMYPYKSPGGWNIIGRTPLILFVFDREPEVYYEPGDYIQFKSITAQEFDEIQQRVLQKEYDVEVLEGDE